MDYLLVKWLHIVSAILLFGTGLGSAFYLFFANRSRDVRAIAVVSRHVVAADWIFTTPTIIIQPATGWYLADDAGWSLSTPWLLWSIVLYVVAGLCWLPVVWLQLRMRAMAGSAASRRAPLPALYWRYARYWTLLGIPAFCAMFIVVYLMVAKPGLTDQAGSSGHPLALKTPGQQNVNFIEVTGYHRVFVVFMYQEQHGQTNMSEQSVKPADSSLISNLIRKPNDCARYVVQDKLASGGMGTIYRVLDRDLNRRNVLKVASAAIVENAALLKEFIEEARITGSLEHPNIVPVHGLGVLENDEPYFSMKYVEGETLGEIIRLLRNGDAARRDSYHTYKLVTIFRKVCDAVAYAHSKNIVHLDIKPENIMVGAFGEVLLLDWGLARIIEPGKPGEVKDDIVIKGTPAFMSPEQANGDSAQIDHRSDIFLLGATLYAAVTHHSPYGGSDIHAVLTKARKRECLPPQASAAGNQIPEAVCAIITKAMAFAKQDRYQSMNELCRDIDAYLSGNMTFTRRGFDRGELLMQEGDHGQEAYVIVSGQVEVTKRLNGKRATLYSLGKGDVIGEMSLILESPRSATVQALEHTEVIVISKETMANALGQLPPWMGRVVDSLAERLRVSSNNMHPLVNGDCSYHVLNQLCLIYCYWGTPCTDSFGEHTIVILNTRDLIEEIATNLSLSKERISYVITLLLESDLLGTHDADFIFIPNFSLFREFIEYCREQAGIPRKFREPGRVDLLGGKGEFIVKHTLPADKPPSSRLAQVTESSIFELFGCDGAEDKLHMFNTVLYQIRTSLKASMHMHDGLQHGGEVDNEPKTLLMYRAETS